MKAMRGPLHLALQEAASEMRIKDSGFRYICDWKRSHVEFMARPRRIMKIQSPWFLKHGIASMKVIYH